VPNSAPIYTAEFIDFGRGQYDLFLGGDEQNPYGILWFPTIIQNDGTEHFGASRTLPGDANFTTTLDILFVNGNVYLNRVHDDPVNGYGFSEIQKIDFNTDAASQIYANTQSFSNGRSWVNWIIPYQGRILSMNSDYGVSVPQ
jgi:hypothetical protein